MLYHGFSPELRNFAVEPVADVKIKKVCDIDNNLVITRRRTGKHLQCITIFDYGFGKEKSVLPVWDDIGEKTIKIEIKSARNVKCLHDSIKKIKRYIHCFIQRCCNVAG